MKLISVAGNPAPGGVVAGKVGTPDEVELRFARWDSPASGRGTVCVFTGRGEFIEKYFETVCDLRQRGFTVAMMDWRGDRGARRGNCRIRARGMSKVFRISRPTLRPSCSEW